MKGKVMLSAKYIWMDGTFVKWEDAKVHVLAQHYTMEMVL